MGLRHYKTPFNSQIHSQMSWLRTNSDNYREFNLFFTLVFSTNFPDQFLIASVLNKLHTDNTDDNNQDRQKSLGACIEMVNEGATNLVETRISLVRSNLFSCFSLKKRTSNPSNHWPWGCGCSGVLVREEPSLKSRECSRKLTSLTPAKGSLGGRGGSRGCSCLHSPVGQHSLGELLLRLSEARSCPSVLGVDLRWMGKTHKGTGLWIQFNKDSQKTAPAPHYWSNKF